MIKLVPAKCPSCGADIEVNKKLENTICQYCGTTVLVDDAIQKYKVELSGEIQVDGISGKKDKYEKAKKFIKLKEYYDAQDILYEIICDDRLDIEGRILYLIAGCEIYNNDAAMKNPEVVDGLDSLEYFVEVYERVIKIDTDETYVKKLSDYNETIEEVKKAYEEKNSYNKSTLNVNNKLGKLYLYARDMIKARSISKLLYDFFGVTDAFYNIDSYSENVRFHVYSTLTSGDLYSTSLNEYEKQKLIDGKINKYQNIIEMSNDIDSRFESFKLEVDKNVKKKNIIQIILIILILLSSQIDPVVFFILAIIFGIVKKSNLF